MSLFLDKVLSAFAFPLGFALALCLLSLALSLLWRTGVWRILFVVAVAGLWIASTPALANLLVAALEDAHPAQPIESTTASDVVVVLGGQVANSHAGPDNPAIGAAGDRLVKAYFLWHAGKAKMILISGGNLPWQPAAKPESELAAQILERLGVPSDLILVETHSQNTRENALYSASIWRAHGFQSGLLLTSAFHMSRALATFRAAGLNVTPWPVDFRRQTLIASNLLDVLPSAEALALTTTCVKEWVGLQVYRWRGWAE
jgi:uncharacterized SAM-binding protein YcdF (DUF218 family)